MLDVPVVRDSPSVSFMRSLRVEHEERRKKMSKAHYKIVFVIILDIYNLFGEKLNG